MAKKEKTTKVDSTLERLKNHKVIAIIVVAGIILIALGNLFDAFDKIGGFFKGKTDDGVKTTTVSLAQLTANTHESYFTSSGKDTLIVQPDEYWRVMALATSVMKDTLIPKAWPRLRYFMSGSKFSPLLDELASANATKIDSVKLRLNPVLDITFLNKGNATAILSGIDFEVSNAEYISGADLARPGAVALQVLNRYQLTIPPLQILKGDSIKLISTNVLPPVEMRSNEAARIQLQFLHNRKSQYHYEGWLKFRFSNAPVLSSGLIKMDF